MHKTWWVLVALITAAESFLPRSIHFLSQKSLGNGGRWLLFGEKKPDMDWDPKAAPKLDFEEDYYSVLEVDPEIKGKDLKKAYYKLVFKYHPDNKEGEEAKALCNKQMMVINNAYQTLKQDEKRSAYNRKRKCGGGMRGGGSSSTPKTSANSGSGFDYDQYGYGQRKATEQNEEKEEDVESLGDIFADMFRDIKNNKGGGVVEDFLDWMEGDSGGKYSPFGDDNGANNGANEKSKQEIDDELEVLVMAIKNLESRYQDVKKSRVEGEKVLLGTKPKAGDPKDIKKLEKRLHQIEEVRSLAARQNEMEKQLRTLKKKRNNLQELRNYLT